MLPVGPKFFDSPLYMREDPYWDKVVLAMHMDGDPYWANTVLSMPMDGADNGVVFTDLKGNTMTAGGGTVTRTINKAFGTASAYFDGVDDYIAFPSLNFLSSMGTIFTMEAWIYPMSVGAYGSAVIGQSGTAGNQDEDFGLNSSGALYYYKTNGMGGANITLAAPYPIPLTSWHHVALVFTGTEAMLFQDGTKVASTPWTETWATHGINGPTIGRSLNTGYPQYVRRFHGYIDGVRITQGIARYTTHFELSTSPFPIGTAFTDEKGHTVTAGGNAVISTAQSRYNGYSAYFDGAGDYLSIPDSDEWWFGSGDFTVECWFRINATTGAHQQLCGQWNGPGMYGWQIVVSSALTTVDMGYSVDGTNTAGISAPATITVGTWYHMALSRRGNTIYLFIDGVVKYSGAFAVTMFNAAVPLYVGMNQHTSAWSMNGYIDDLRITKGIGRYISNFNPPPRFPSYTPTDPYYSSVVLRMPFNGAHGSTAITDEKGKAVTVVGNAQLSATQSRFGPTACYFDGNGDYLTTPSSTDFDFGTGDFTVECWVYVINVGNTGTFIARQQAGASMAFQLRTSGSVQVIVRSPSGTDLLTLVGTTTPVNTWFHLAASRASGTLRLFLDGVLVAQAASTHNLTPTVARPLTIGALDDTTVTGYFTGYIDDVRITKGVARYTAGFTSIRAPFPNW